MFSSTQVVTSTSTSAEPALPVFSTREARFRKARDANTLVFSVPTRSSLLLPLLRPVSHAYEQQDARCLYLLQAAALVPSCKSDKLRATVAQALKMPLAPQLKRQLEETLRPLLLKLQASEEQERPLLALQLKEKVADCLRRWIAEPVHGFVLRKEHVVGGMRLDDLVATPAGAGYLRGYRGEDGFCTVVYPWGHGFVHVKDVEKVQQAIEKHLRKRSFNEYVALEHQQMFEQIEGLLENLPPPAPEEEGGEASQKEKDREEVDVEEYKELLKSLEEEHVDTTALREDLGFLRRVQALANKVKEIRRAHAPKEPEHKVMRTEVDDEMPAAEDEQLDDVDSAAQQPQSEEQEQVIDVEKGPQLVERKDDSEAA